MLPPNATVERAHACNTLATRFLIGANYLTDNTRLNGGIAAEDVSGRCSAHARIARPHAVSRQTVALTLRGVPAIPPAVERRNIAERSKRRYSSHDHLAPRDAAGFGRASAMRADAKSSGTITIQANAATKANYPND